MNRKTAQYQLTKRFISIFLGVLFVMNLFFFMAASTFVYEFLENKATGVMSSLKKESGQQIDWEYSVDKFISEKDDDALIVQTRVGETFYSKDSQKIFKKLYHGKSIPFLKPIIFSEEGIYFVKNQEFENFNVQLAISAETAIELAFGMLVIGLVLNALAVILGGFLIYWSVQKWSMKLSQMATEINQINSLGEEFLTVPNDPIEMTEVATSFNQLLIEQREAMEREKQFITNASHDLRTPVAAIRGHVQLIRRRGEAHPEIIPESVEFIDKESKRLEKLSNQLLILEKQEMNAPKETINLSSILLHEVEKLAVLYEREIINNIESEIMFESYSGDMEQLFQNIIENGIKYSPKESVIHVSLKEKQRQIIFSVTDEGIGISEDNKKQVFDRFYRVDNARTSHIEGSGIGLSIVKKIVQRYKGEIIIEDNHPKGTVFEFYLPKMK